MGRVDRSPLFLQAFKEGFLSHPIVDKIKHIFTLLVMMFLMIIPAKLGLSKQKPRFKKLADDVLVVSHIAGTNCYAFRKENEILIVGGAPPASTLPQIQSELGGKVTAVLIVDAQHESFADAFVEAVKKQNGGTRPVVICPSEQRKLVEEAVHVDENAENNDVLRKFGFQNIISNPSCVRGYCGGSDRIWNFRLAGDRTVLIGPCPFGNVQESSIPLRLAGFFGRRVFRMYRLTFVKDVNLLKKTWEAATNVPNISMFLPQHGEAITSDVNATMRKWRW